jgi:nucleoside-diphosphate-sugar epimerase
MRADRTGPHRPPTHTHSFCGWPTALYLSEQGHDVIVLDNLSRRDIDNELGCQSLTPIATPEVRVRTWEQVSGRTMRFVNLDVAKDFAELVQVCGEGAREGWNGMTGGVGGGCGVGGLTCH